MIYHRKNGNFTSWRSGKKSHYLAAINSRPLSSVFSPI
jgi:hypothetical protein